MNKYAVIGNPVAHSRSPEIHALFARQAGLEISYERLLAPAREFESTAREFIAGGGQGFNVTVPFKHEAFAMVEHSSDDVALAEAVNTVTVGSDGNLQGDNTDGPGLVRDIEQNLGWQIESRRVLILGAGGAVAGVLASIVRRHPDVLHICNRTHSKAEQLADKFELMSGRSEVRAIQQKDLAEPYDLIVNGTSAGLLGEALSIKNTLVGNNTLCYDMTYGKETTEFNRWAIRAGSKECADGLGMLVEQAALAFDIWLGFTPKTAPVIESLRELIHRS